MSKVLLAIDVGGSSSRAHIVDKTGHCRGRGRNRGGNPASTGPEEAAEAIVAAVSAALADAGGGPFEIEGALIALAGPKAHVAKARLEAAFHDFGLSGPIVFAGDLLAMFASATAAHEGYCLVAGTGAGVVRIRAGVIDKAVDAAGWLLGDLGSGYWLGHQAAKAVVAELDGRGEASALTPALLDGLDIDWCDGRASDGRPVALRAFTDAIYALRPIELARFAPLVVANRGDAVAARLLAAAERYLVADFQAAFDPGLAGPVVIGGGVSAHLAGLGAAIAGIVRAGGQTPDIRPVSDGSVGAVVLALRADGVKVDEAMREKIAASVAAR